MIMQIAPIHANHEIRLRVRILEKITVMIAAIATNIAVQTECIERAFRAMETLSMAEPEQNVKTGKNIRILLSFKRKSLGNPRFPGRELLQRVNAAAKNSRPI